MKARGTESPESVRRAAVPRANSSTIVAATKAEKVYAISPGNDEPAPSAISRIPTASAKTVGPKKIRFSDESDARRQAISGPIPISRSRGSPKLRKKKL